MSLLYINCIESKNGITIPVLHTGATLYSRYNPQHDWELFASIPHFATAGFFVIGGIGSGDHLRAVQKKFPDAVIIAVEPDNETIDFLRSHFNLPEESEKLIFSTFEDLHKKITLSYLPACHGNFCLETIRNWEQSLLEDQKQQFGNAVQDSLASVSRDYGVQAHFGKIWQKNILQNYYTYCSNTETKSFINWKKLSESLRKRKITGCTVVAAGPSLDHAAGDLQTLSLSGQWIIAVDTALPVLMKNNIIPDMIVTIDAQIASMEHFFSWNDHRLSRTILAADFCGTPGAVSAWLDVQRPVLFFNENHPLSLYCTESLHQKKDSILNISAGGGTVTHSAVELASALGFERIQLTGADFSFPGNKPYARGTYLETRFTASCDRISPLEEHYANLMLRTELLTDSETGNKTTKVLSAYKAALRDRWPHLLQKKSDQYAERKELTSTVIKPDENLDQNWKPDVHSFHEFCRKYCIDIKNNEKKVLFSTLPYTAYLKSRAQLSDKQIRERIISSVEKLL